MSSLAVAAVLSGCANPGPPRPPSLHLPTPPRDLAAERTGDTVELHFTAPRLSTDKLKLPTKTLRGSFCRQEGKDSPCITPPGAGGTFDILDAAGKPATVTWRDTLPPALASGQLRRLLYRVELFNEAGRSAGPSDAAYTVAGDAPPMVQQLSAQGSRRGVVLSWKPEPGTAAEVLLRRDNEAPHAPATPRKQASGNPLGLSAKRADAEDAEGVLWLSAGVATPASPAAPASSTMPASRTLDASAQLATPYAYRAARRQTIRLGGRTLELRSELSPPVRITLQPVYASAPPTGLVAAAFSNAASPDSKAPFAVDLVWQPVDDAEIAGYNVYRQRLDATNAPQGPREKLTATPAREPGFHDATAQPSARYRYSVTAIDAHGNESEAAKTVLEPTDPQ